MERGVRGLIALAAWAGMGIQLWLQLERPDFASQLAAVWNLLAYFTILTNLMVAIVCTVAALVPDSASGRLLAGANTRLGVVVYIVMVGIVYHLLLANLWAPQDWQMIADQLLHTATPLMMALAWLAFDDKRGLTLKALPQIIVYPVGYTIYALIRGAADGFYPYPFLDVSQFGYARVVLNIAGLAAAFLLGAGVLILIGRWLGGLKLRRTPAKS